MAFPALSTGAFGFPMGPAARIALQAVLDRAPSLDSVSLVRFVLFDDEAFEAHQEAMSSLLDEAA